MGCCLGIYLFQFRCCSYVCQDKSSLPKRLVQVFLTWPCQSDVLTRMMLSGRWLSDTRMWLSWSYTVFLGIYAGLKSGPIKHV